MRRSFIVLLASFSIPAVVLGATDIPTRYSGSFPTTGLASNVTGTFTGKSLTIRYTFKTAGGNFQATGRYSCNATSANSTRCDGTRTVDNGGTAKSGVTIRWKAGKPIWSHIDKPTPL